MRLIIVGTLSIWLLLSCSQSSDSLTSAKEPVWADSLTVALDEIYQQRHINGVGVGIVNESGVLYKKGFGFADVETEQSYTNQTIQNIASISKTLIGIALMRAQEMGKLRLDDPVNEYLPFSVSNPYFPNEEILIRHLATHTSSITDTDYYDKSYVISDEEDTSTSRSVPDESVVSDSVISIGAFLEKYLTPQGEWYMEDGFLEKKPGERYEYSNVAATLAAYIIERATGVLHDAFTKDHILTRLGMYQSGWSIDSINADLFSQRYEDTETAYPFYTLITYPDGGLLTSISDMSLYLTELIRGYKGKGELLSAESYKELFKPQLTKANYEERDTDRDFDDEYNTGIFMGYTPIGHVGHTGGDPGVSTFMFFDPETGIGRLLFVNTDFSEEGVKQFIATWEVLGEYPK